MGEEDQNREDSSAPENRQSAAAGVTSAGSDEPTFKAQVLTFFAAGVAAYLLLSVANRGYRGYLEVRYWKSLAQAPSVANELERELRRELEQTPTPINESMRLLASRGRESFPELRADPVPRPPVAGWVRGAAFEARVRIAETWKLEHERAKDPLPSAREVRGAP